MKRLAVAVGLLGVGIFFWPRFALAQACIYGNCAGGCVDTVDCNNIGDDYSCSRTSGCSWTANGCEGTFCYNNFYCTNIHDQPTCLSTPGCGPFTKTCCDFSNTSSSTYVAGNGYCSNSCGGTCNYITGTTLYSASCAPTPQSNAVFLSFPAKGGVINNPTAAATVSVNFTWAAANNATKYTLMLWDMTTNGSGAAFSCTATDNHCKDVTAPSYTYSVKKGHKYMWWVYSYNSCNTPGGRSEDWTFKVKTGCEIDTKPTITNPAYSGYYHPGVISTINWDPPTGSPTPSKYLVRIHDRDVSPYTRTFSGCQGDFGPANNAADYCGVTTARSFSISTYKATGLADGHKYTIWIRPVDCSGTTEFLAPADSQTVWITSACIPSSVCQDACSDPDGDGKGTCHNNCNGTMNCFANVLSSKAGVVTYKTSLITDVGGVLNIEKISPAHWKAKSDSGLIASKYIDYNYWAGTNGLLTGLADSTLMPNSLGASALSGFMPDTATTLIVKKTSSAGLTISGSQNLGGGEEGKLIVIVDGDLIVNNDITRTNKSSFLMFIAKNITVASSVTRLDGVYLATEDFTFSASGGNDVQFVGNGMFFAGKFGLGRNLGSEANKTKPAHVFNYDSSLILNAPQAIKPGNYSWKEVAP